MKFPWNEYNELPLSRRNTLQIFITSICNFNCNGCFAKNVMYWNDKYISVEEYYNAIQTGLDKGASQINLLGGEPLLHPQIKLFLDINRGYGLKTTLYTNGTFINRFTLKDLLNVKFRVSLSCEMGHRKNFLNLPRTDFAIDANIMVTANTTVNELLECASHMEKHFNCNTFFIFSMREMDNDRKEFFDDTVNTMPVIKYKELVHNFMNKYTGNMDIHVSKRGVFESTGTLPDRKCRFANYFIGKRIIQCPYDVVNLKFQNDYEFGVRNCQQNNTCLMSKVIYRRK